MNNIIGLFLDLFSEEQLKERDENIIYKMEEGYKGLDVRVIASIIPPRDSRWQYCLEIGKDKIEYIFDGTPLGMSRLKNIGLFCFPERWLNPKEESDFMLKIIDGFRTKFNKFWILTGSPVILTDCVGEMVRVFDYEDNS